MKKENIYDEPRTYLAPDYDRSDDDDDDDDDIEDFDEDIDEDGEDEAIENFLDNQEKQKEINNNNTTTVNNMQSSSLFGSTPSQTSGWGNSGSSWGNTTPQNNPSPWTMNNNNSSPWGNTGTQRTGFWGSGTGTSHWGSSSNLEKKEIDRSKRVIVCDVLDCLVETLQSNGKPGLLPRGIFDIRLRFEVWDKIACFAPDKILATVPRTILSNSSNGSDSCRVLLEYVVCCLSEYLRSPYQVCQIVLQTEIGQPKEEVLSRVLGDIPKESIIMLGINSGLYGQNNRDQLAAMRCGIDYIDLNTFMNSYH